MTSANLDLLGSFFNEQDYLAKYPDARLAVASGAFPSGQAHFLQVGMGERRNINPSFDATYYLTENADFLEASPNNDLIVAREGGDNLLGNSGNDAIFGNENDDRLFGNTGGDSLYGNAGADSLYGGKNNDIISIANCIPKIR